MVVGTLTPGTPEQHSRPHLGCTNWLVFLDLSNGLGLELPDVTSCVGTKTRARMVVGTLTPDTQEPHSRPHLSCTY